MFSKPRAIEGKKTNHLRSSIPKYHHSSVEVTANMGRVGQNSDFPYSFSKPNKSPLPGTPGQWAVSFKGQAVGSIREDRSQSLGAANLFKTENVSI